MHLITVKTSKLMVNEVCHRAVFGSTPDTIALHGTSAVCKCKVHLRVGVGWFGRRDEAAVEVGRKVGGADTGESVLWGVVQWRLPEVLCELQREQEMSVEHGQYVSVLCVYTQQ